MAPFNQVAPEKLMQSNGAPPAGGPVHSVVLVGSPLSVAELQALKAKIDNLQKAWGATFLVSILIIIIESVSQNHKWAVGWAVFFLTSIGIRLHRNTLVQKYNTAIALPGMIV